MIQKSPSSKKTSPRRQTSATRVARERQAIQSGWTPEQRQSRGGINRIDQAERRFQAHLRFIEFLVAQADCSR